MGYEDENLARRNRNRSWWQQRTPMERYVIYALVIAGLVIIGLIVGIAIVSKKHKTAASSSLENVCLTPACVNTANQILKLIDQSADPCDDFYQFACGGFDRDTVIPPDKAQVQQFSLLDDHVQKQLQVLLEEPIQPKEPKPFRLVKQLFQICLNTSSIERDGLKPVHNLIQKLGGWPVLSKQAWNEEGFNWVNTAQLFRQNLLSSGDFISIGIEPDSKNSTRRQLILDQPKIGVPRDNLLKGYNDRITKAYYEYMVDLAVIFGAEKVFAEFEVKNMIDFQIKLAEITLSEEQRQNPDALYNPMTIGELKRRHPSIPLLELINGLIGRAENAVTYGEIINVKVPQYIVKLEHLLNTTPKRVQANYVFFKNIKTIVDFLPEYVRNRALQFMAAAAGVSVRPPRAVECAKDVIDTLELATGALYVRKYFEEETRHSAREMINDLRNEFIQIIKGLSWMDKQTKEAAIEKAEALVTHIGYPDEFLDDKKLEEHYSNLKFTTQNYMTSMMEVGLFMLDDLFGKLHEPINKTDWRSRVSVTEVNAGYSPNENSVQLPASILQGIFFNKDRPHYMNYGGIAYVIGHEITHGFDTQGKQYDKEGNLVNWWAPETDKAFAEKAECIVQQYGEYVVPETGTKMNGRLTVGENIADNGGIKESYLAYNNWVKRNAEEPTLPGLNYTAKQLFWISAAHCWCTKTRKEALETVLTTDEHSPGRFRIIGPFSNTEYFSKDYNCPAGSKMNPKRKCAVW